MNKYREALHKALLLCCSGKGYGAIEILNSLLKDNDLLLVDKNNLSIDVSEVEYRDASGYRAVITNGSMQLADTEQMEQFGEIIKQTCVENLYRYLEEGKDNEN